jgi:hypothetical protein
MSDLLGCGILLVGAIFLMIVGFVLLMVCSFVIRAVLFNLGWH